MLLPASYQTLAHILHDKNLKLNEPLSRHTYFKLGGPADLFLETYTVDDLVFAVSSAIDTHVPYLVIGSGSNLIITDKGFRGLIIKNKSNSLQLKGFTGKIQKKAGSSTGRQMALKEVIVQSDSGVPTNKLVRYSLDEGLQGLEPFLGLPGTVGGAIYNNSHHLNFMIGDYIIEVVVLDLKGNRKRYSQADLQFDYDHSLLQKTREIVLTASFQLKKGDKAKLWKLATTAVQRRASTQPLGLPSSGCIFRNIPLSDAMRLGIPNHLVSAGYLIDRAGLKDKRVGGASVSDVHANFIVNDGSATTQDVLDLVELIKKTVKLKFGVTLELETFLVGEK